MKTKPKFKKGEWCFCEFVLQQVKETDEDRITSVTDGMFEHGGRDLSDRCFPLTIPIKRLSDHTKYWHDKLHELKSINLNHPDINRKLIELWADGCNRIGEEEFLKISYERIGSFAKAIIKSVEDTQSVYVEGVRLTR